MFREAGRMSGADSKLCAGGLRPVPVTGAPLIYPLQLETDLSPFTPALFPLDS